MKIVCTVCSREKEKRGKYLPAGARYQGEHVARAAAYARAAGLPLYFVSGEFGLVAEGKLIPCYDHRLRANEAGRVARLMEERLAGLRVAEIFFCDELRESWAPYREALMRAAGALGVPIYIVRL